MVCFSFFSVLFFSVLVFSFLFFSFFFFSFLFYLLLTLLTITINNFVNLIKTEKGDPLCDMALRRLPPPKCGTIEEENLRKVILNQPWQAERVCFGVSVVRGDQSYCGSGVG